MFIDKIRKQIRETAETIREGGAVVASAVADRRSVKEEDPLIRNVEKRNYVYWKKAWTGTLQSRSRGRRH